MIIIDIDKWQGKKHYLWFKRYQVHYYGVTKNIDITKLYFYIKNNNYNFFISFMYLVNLALNTIAEFKLRVENEKVVLFDVINPAYTIMTSDGIYDNCEHEFADNFCKYYQSAVNAIEIVKSKFNENKSYNDLSRTDQYYFTCIPWITFTSITHPMPNDESAFVPRITWGKYYQDDEKIKIPFNLHVSHALIDGFPLANGFIKVQEYVNNCEKYLK